MTRPGTTSTCRVTATAAGNRGAITPAPVSTPTTSRGRRPPCRPLGDTLLVPLTRPDRSVLWVAIDARDVREAVRKSRADQGLPPVVQDPGVLRLVTTILSEGMRGRSVA